MLKYEDSIELVATPALIAFFGYVVRAVIRKKNVTLIGFLVDAVAAVALGIMVGNVISIYTIPQQAQAAIIALSGLIGPDIAAGILIMATMFKESPSAFVLKHVYALRGKDPGEGVIKDAKEWEREHIEGKKEEETKEEVKS